jgi:hypothetical protein
LEYQFQQPGNGGLPVVLAKPRKQISPANIESAGDVSILRKKRGIMQTVRPSLPNHVGSFVARHNPQFDEVREVPFIVRSTSELVYLQEKVHLQ